MLPNFKICDCCGKKIPLDDGKIHTEWSEHTAHCSSIPAPNDPETRIDCLVDFVFKRRQPCSSATVVPAGRNDADLCTDCKLMLLENAVEYLKKYH